MQNLRLKEHFQNDKSRFFRQQAFDGNNRLKKWGCFCAIVIFAYEILITLVLLPKDVRYSATHASVMSIMLFVIALITYYISVFKFFERMTKKIFIIRYLLIWICVLSFSVAQAFKVYDEIMDRVAHNSIEKWFYSLIKGRNEIWTILLMDTLVPIWYVKLIPPISYWIAQILAYYNLDLMYKAVVLGCFVFSMSIMTVLWGMRTYHEWKVFVNRLNIEAWDDVHQYILDKVPDAIAVLDSNTKVIYSNSTFKALCQDNMTDLSQKLTQCKKSDTDFLSESEYNNLSNKSEPKFYTLTEILQKNIAPLIRGDDKLGNYLNFSAKMLNHSDQGQISRSYEIKLGPLIKYGKAILILSDTTQRDLAISLETANQYKDKLLATVSHDLRAPINGSMSLIESSIDHEAVPEFIKEQFLTPALRSCKFLLHLANDILDFSQINAQKLRMNFETNSLLETIKGCYQLLEMQASKKRIDFYLVLADDLPEKFTTDHNRLSQVILNLLTNAIKFTFSGSVTLRAFVEDNQVHIKVVDTGIGIQDKDKEKLFQEFTRIEYEQQDMNARGVGLGLVIANKLAIRLGPVHQRKGISFSSVYGKGSTFEFLLEDKKNIEEDKERRPKRENSLTKAKVEINLGLTSVTYREEDFLFQKIDEGDPLQDKSRYSSIVKSNFNTRGRLPSYEGSVQLNLTNLVTSPKKKQFVGRVLVVDDNAFNIVAIESLLKKFGVTVDAAYNGKEAIDKVLQSQNNQYFLKPDIYEKIGDTSNQHLISNQYQIIFMDVEMPIINGIQTTKTLRDLMENKQINYIPIIGSTAHQDEELTRECIMSGMIDVMTKPQTKEKFLEILERYLNTDSPKSSCASPFSL